MRWKLHSYLWSTFPYHFSSFRPHNELRDESTLLIYHWSFRFKISRGAVVWFILSKHHNQLLLGIFTQQQRFRTQLERLRKIRPNGKRKMSFWHLPWRRNVLHSKIHCDGKSSHSNSESKLYMKSGRLHSFHAINLYSSS